MKLKSIEAPQPNWRLQFIGDRVPLVRGQGPETYHCSECDESLLVGIRPAEIVDAVFRCPRCDASNEVDMDDVESCAVRTAGGSDGEIGRGRKADVTLKPEVAADKIDHTERRDRGAPGAKPRH